MLLGTIGQSFGQARRLLPFGDSLSDRLLIALQIGFSVLAAVPGSDTVFPLLGRPHDSLPRQGERYVI